MGWFAAECGAVGMKVITSKSKAMVLSQKTVYDFLCVESELLPQEREFNHLRVLFMSHSTMEREMDSLVQWLL